MKRLISLILVFALLTGCTTTVAPENNAETVKNTTVEIVDKPLDESLDSVPEFDELSDPALLQYIEDNIYSELEAKFASDDYIIENISTVYVSQEYLEEVTFNSQSNIYFGYTLAEIDKQFEGQRYVFCLGENGETIVKAFEKYDDTFEQILKNISLGTGIIFVFVTVSVVSGGAGAPVVSMIFSAAAKTGTICALSSGAISSVAAGVTTGMETGDFDEALKAASLAGSESFKWGAITGTSWSGIISALNIFRKSKTIPTPTDSEDEVFKRTQKTDGTKNTKKQVSYLGGKEVSSTTQGATRPDVVVKNTDGTVRAIEVKNYDLVNNKNSLLNTLEDQVSDRVKHLPKGSTQEIVLDVRGRNYSKELINNTISDIKTHLSDIYPDISVTAMAS